MNILSVENLTRHYGTKVLFEKISFGLQKGDKAGIIAPNGSGKTTLLKTLAGLDEADEGEYTWNGAAKVVYLSQDPALAPDKTVLECLFEQAGKAGKALEDYYRLQKGDYQNDAEYQNAMLRVEEHKGWELDALARKLLSQLEIKDIQQKAGQLSGGQIKRVALAALLLSDPDVLLLDEPTNHLDLPMTEWLEKFLERTNITLLMVTHDRYFLNRVCSQILEIDQAKMYTYEGNYHYFLEKKSERELTDAVVTEKAKRLLKQETEWMKKQPKARGTKSKARAERIDSIREKATGKAPAPEMDFGVKIKRLGKKVIELKRISHKFDDLLIFDKLSYSFKQNEKLGITGKNGTGKTTFLDVLADKLQPDEGKVIFGETLKVGYYRQTGMQLNEDKRVIDVIREISESIPVGEGYALSAEQFLEKFMFDRKSQQQLVSTLSGGEKKRLYLVTVLISGPNFLLLDEPTNDLDLFTINQLEDFLVQFPGSAVIVTHDRYFLDKMIDHLFVFRGDGEIKDYPGNYSQYRAYVEDAEKKVKKAKASDQQSKEKTAKKRPGKLSYKEKKEYDELETSIRELEKERAELEDALNDPNRNAEELTEISEKFAGIVKTIEAKTERWFELAEKTEQS